MKMPGSRSIAMSRGPSQDQSLQGCVVNFRIADTFTDSLAKLTSEEQKTVKTTVFDLQANPKHPSLQFHRIEQARDGRFWSIRGNLDLRLIVHKDGDDLLVCYVDHHDDAYEWARRRRIEVHPKTGAAQLVEIRESVREIVVPKYVEKERPAPQKPTLFNRLSDDELLAFGVPTDWLADARMATEDTIFDLSDHLPREAAEALLELATGGKPTPQTQASATASPFEHPDAQRRFRVMRNVEELERALDAPWEKEKPSSRCTAPCFSLGATRRRACSSRPFPIHSQTLCA